VLFESTSAIVAFLLTTSAVKKKILPQRASFSFFQVVKLDHNHTVYEDILCPPLTTKFTFKKGLSSCWSYEPGEHGISTSTCCLKRLDSDENEGKKPKVTIIMTISINNDYRITILHVNYS